MGTRLNFTKEEVRRKVDEERRDYFDAIGLKNRPQVSKGYFCDLLEKSYVLQSCDVNTHSTTVSIKLVQSADLVQLLQESGIKCRRVQQELEDIGAQPGYVSIEAAYRLFNKHHWLTPIVSYLEQKLP